MTSVAHQIETDNSGTLGPLHSALSQWVLRTACT